jgi:hypothetical protein
MHYIVTTYHLLGHVNYNLLFSTEISLAKYKKELNKRNCMRLGVCFRILDGGGRRVQVAGGPG